MYNPPAVFIYSNNNGSHARARLLNQLQSAEITIEQLSTNTVPIYIRERYLKNADEFINKYQTSVDI
jgi:hypothetical protein